jgi:hypothetical protein
MRSALCRQNGQWVNEGADDGAESCSCEGCAESAPTLEVTVRGPSLVQISMLWVSPSHATACDTVGASAMNSATHTASHNAQGRSGG